MEIVVVIVIILFTLISVSKTSVQNAGKGPQANRRARPTAVKAAPAAARTTPQARPTVATPVEPVEGDAMLEDDECAGGSMPHEHIQGHSALEDEECAGGSMAHEHSEGLERVEVMARMERLDSLREAEDGRAHEPLIHAGDVDLKALRRAVVMAEVLGRPRALKARR